MSDYCVKISSNTKPATKPAKAQKTDVFKSIKTNFSSRATTNSISSCTNDEDEEDDEDLGDFVDDATDMDTDDMNKLENTDTASTSSSNTAHTNENNSRRKQHKPIRIANQIEKDLVNQSTNNISSTASSLNPTTCSIVATHSELDSISNKNTSSSSAINNNSSNNKRKTTKEKNRLNKLEEESTKSSSSSSSLSLPSSSSNTEEEETQHDSDEELGQHILSNINETKKKRNNKNDTNKSNLLSIDDEENLDSNKSNFLICQYCNDKNKTKFLFKDIKELKDHIYEHHIDLVLNTITNTNLASTLLTNNSKTLTETDNKKTPKTATQTNASTNLNSSKSMESFCTICKKEVCNKYFLKSHLLNKHGVQLDDYLAAQNAASAATAAAVAAVAQSQSSLVATNQSPTSLAAAVANELIDSQNINLQALNQVMAASKLSSLFNNGSANGVDLFQMAKLNKYSNNDEENEQEDEEYNQQYSGYNNNSNYGQYESDNEDGEINESESTDANTAIFNHYLSLALKQQQQQQQGNAFQNLDLLQNNLNLSGLLAGSNSSGNNQSATSTDFCDICQKQFCNKYYLKKHKLDVHGITSSASSAIPASNNSLLSTSGLNNTEKAKKSIDSTKNISSTSSAVADPNLTSTLSMLMNPFLNPAVQFANNQTRSNMSSSPSSNSSASSTSSTSSLSCSSSSTSLNKNKLPNAKTDANDDAASNKPNALILNEDKIKLVDLKGNQNMSIIPNNKLTNSNEVKCDQCTKVFFNKEFLALHKLNKHDPAKQLDANHNKENNSLIKHDEMSLKLPVQLAQCQTSKPVSNLLQNKAESSNILTNEAFCEYCNKSFCNKYFLRTHMNKAHGKTLIIENNSNNTIINSLINSNKSKSGMSDYDEDGELINSSNGDDPSLNLNETYFASKIVDRVACDICNKQVCNKYFLRTHKQKVHGIYESNGVTFSRAHNVNGMQQTNEMSDGEVEDGYMEHMEEDYEQKQDDDKELGELVMSDYHVKPTHRKRSCSSSSVISSESYESIKSKENQLNKLVQSIQQQKVLSSRHAFCDMCKRQFYSKSFLRNHMKKIHGIKLDDDVENNNENSLNPTEAANEAEADDYHHHHEVRLNNEEEKRPKLKISFPFQTHSTTNPTSSENMNRVRKLNRKTKKLIKKKAFNLLNRTNLSNSSLMNVMSTVRVNCNICNKELCNKYFLRQHVAKSHSLSFEQYIEKYDNVDNETNSKYNQIITHSLARSILLNHQNLLSSNLNGQMSGSSKFKKGNMMRSKRLMKAIKLSQASKSLSKAEENSKDAQPSQTQQSRKRKHSGSSCVSSVSKISSCISVESHSSSAKHPRIADDENAELNLQMLLAKVINNKSLYEGSVGYEDLKPFMMETVGDGEESEAACLIYLPYKKLKLNDDMTIRIKLKPVEDAAIAKNESNDKIDNDAGGSNGGALVNFHLQLQEKFKN